MCHVWAVVFCLVVSSFSACRESRADLFGGYSYINFDINSLSSRQNANGWEMLVSGNFNKLAAGADAADVVSAIAEDIKIKERTVRRHFSACKKAADDIGSETSSVMNILAGHVLPDNRTPARPTPFRPHVDALSGAAPANSSYVN